MRPGRASAFRSATSDLAVAVKYARSDVGGSQGGGSFNGGSFNTRSNSSLLFRIRAHSFMGHGANLAFLSLFPQEASPAAARMSSRRARTRGITAHPRIVHRRRGQAEYCYPPMTFLRPTGGVYTVAFDDVLYTVVDVEPHFPS